MTTIEYLKDHNVKFKVTGHHPAYTAVDLAVQEHVLSYKVAKPVVVKADGIYYLCVLPGCFKIDFEILKQQLHVNEVVLATEDEMAGLFGDCQLGAESPLGNLYGLPTLMDNSLERDRHILFAAGTHDKAIRMSMKDFKRLVNPHIISFIERQEFDEIEAMLYDPYFYDAFVYNPLYPL
ncbi:MAG: YbaK/EbsC family protein [Planctomycetes bacterium]|nr:YbaK/EbsC family protein [Planctomycetota bacterium]